MYSLKTKSQFVEDLIERKETLTTMRIFHDWLEEFTDDDQSIELLNRMISHAEKLAAKEIVKYSRWDVSVLPMCTWMNGCINIILASTHINRDNLEINNRTPLASYWYTWSRSLGDSNDKSEIPYSIMQYLNGWNITKRPAGHYANSTDYSETRDPHKALAYACWDWGCDEVRNFFGVPRKMVKNDQR